MRTTLAAAILAAIIPAVAVHAQDSEKLKVGSKAPTDLAAHLELVQGGPIAPLVGDKVSVVEFWATWCGPCKVSIPHINQLYQDLSAKGLQVIGISDEPMDKVKPFVREKGSAMSYTVACMKESDDSIKEHWMKAAGQDGIPCAFIVSRAGKVCYIGHPMDPQFERVLRLALANRYDPELTRRVQPTLDAARKAAKLRNFKEAERLYDDVVKEGPGVMVDVGLEAWKMRAEQANDAAGAKAYAAKLIDTVGKDKYALMAIADYLATNPDLKVRDLDAAQVAAQKVKELASSDDSDALAVVASVAAARGDLATAAEVQYDAWMAAPPSAKPAMKRALDTYNDKKKAGAAATAK